MQFDLANLPEEIPVFGSIFGPVFFTDAIGLDIYGIARRYTGPVLILHGDQDAAVPLSYSQRYASAYTDASLRIIEGGAHVFGGKALDEVIRLTADFLTAKNK